MSDQLMRYYERELAYIRKALSGFAQRFPEQAEQLQLNKNSVEDPSITRLLDGMALLTARTELRLDEQLPDILQDLLNLLYPGYCQIAPSYCPIQLEEDPEQLSETVILPAGSQLTLPLPETQQSEAREALFTTSDDLVIYPFRIQDVRAEIAPFNHEPPPGVKNAEGVIEIELSCCDPEGLFNQLDVEHLDFYVRGFERNADSLMELLLKEVQYISVGDPSGQDYRILDTDQLKSRIADPELQFLPAYLQQFTGYDLLRDYFIYPDKAAYFRLSHFGQGLKTLAHNTLVLRLYVRYLPAEFLRMFDTRVFSLNTVPALNLFRQQGEPLNYDFSQLTMPVVADIGNSSEMEVVSIQEIREVLPDSERRVVPLYEARYQVSENPLQWQGRQRWDENSQRHMELSLSSPYYLPDQDNVVLAMDLMCCNGRSPCLVAEGTEVESLESIDLPGELKVVSTPSSPRYPALDNSLYWRFIALLNNNFASLLQTHDPVAALKDVLTLCSQSQLCQAAEAIREVSYRQEVSTMNVCGQNTFASGTRVRVTVDTDTLDASFAVFSQVLNSFFQQFCSFDRFIQVSISQFGNDANQHDFPAVHGSQLCF